jgi:hypothetical protein
MFVENTTDNCILIVRDPNILGVISVMASITFHGMLLSTRHLVHAVITPRRLGSHVKFITHPLIDLNRPLEIGDYNKIMKKL